MSNLLEALFGSGLRELDEYESCVESVTAQEILALAKRYFVPGRRVEGVVRGVGKTV